jgi:hypothetical protein
MASLLVPAVEGLCAPQTQLTLTYCGENCSLHSKDEPLRLQRNCQDIQSSMSGGPYSLANAVQPAVTNRLPAGQYRFTE